MEKRWRLTGRYGQAILEATVAITEQFLESEIREVFQTMRTSLRGYKVLLFGSRARGNADRTSDFDVGIIGERPLDLETFYAIADALETLPTLYSIDWVDLNRTSDKLRKQALKEGKLLYEG